MLHYINKVLSKIFNYKSYTQNPIKKITNYLHYVCIAFVVKFLGISFQTLQIRLTQIYCILLQTNKLTLELFPNFIKNIFIWSLNYNDVAPFFNKIKNYKQLYNIRQHSYNSIHNFWVIKSGKTIKYYNELNCKKVMDVEIANFFYNINAKQIKYNLVIFYFFNKLVLTKSPYFYWRYVNNYTNNITNSNKSRHMREVLFFIYINTLTSYDYLTSKSFVKTTFNTFKGVSNFFKLDTRSIDFYVESVQKTQMFKPITMSITNNVTAFAAYSNNKSIEQTHIFLNAISINLNNYKNRIYTITVSSIVSASKNLALVWYNKIHNTTLNGPSKTLILYLRAARHFNKGRYSRNRQLYRTGVYWCIWLNVVIVYALHYCFYRVTFAFGYLWLPFCIMILSIFSSRLYKYRYYSITQLMVEFKEYTNLLYFFLLKFNVYLLNIFLNIKKQIGNFFQNYKTLLYTYIEMLIIDIKKLLNL